MIKTGRKEGRKTFTAPVAEFSEGNFGKSINTFTRAHFTAIS